MLILASNSPRRKELLEQIGCDFVSKSACVSEVSADEESCPSKLVMRNAVLKAKAVFDSINNIDNNENNNAVLGADTVVFCGGRIYGKPKNADEAFSMLKNLSGRAHQVYTGIALCKNGQIWQDFAVTDVYMKNLTDEEIAAYAKSGEPDDKAGGYAIQGRASVFVEKINGCYFNVVGLPLNCLYNLAGKAGIAL